MSQRDESRWVQAMLERLDRRERRTYRTDAELMARARALSDTYLGGIAYPESVRWVGNQTSRWGSCTPGERTIRLSDRLQQMPHWVQDYVLIHELVHLIEPHHDERFWSWVANYPDTERAKGYLLGYSAAANLEPPPGEEGEDGEDEALEVGRDVGGDAGGDAGPPPASPPEAPLDF